MQRYRVLAVLLSLAPLLTSAASANEVADGDDFRTVAMPLLEKYCYKCHDDDTQKGELNLFEYADTTQVIADRKLWLRVLEQLETREMPTGETFDGVAELKRYILRERRDDFLRGVSEAMLKFALGRDLDGFDEPVMVEILAALEEKNFDASLLIEEVVLSYPFRNQGSGD